MEGCKVNNIPSDEDFARAHQYMKNRSHNLDKVRDGILGHFKRVSPLYDFYILDQGDVDFRAYVFFQNDSDVEMCKNNGVAQALMDYVYMELERAGRGKKGEISVVFEFDSDENVHAKYNGNYFFRLR